MRKRSSFIVKIVKIALNSNKKIKLKKKEELTLIDGYNKFVKVVNFDYSRTRGNI